MERREPFSYRATKDGRVRIDWKGRTVTVLRGAGAKRLLAKVDDADQRPFSLSLPRPGQLQARERTTGRLTLPRLSTRWKPPPPIEGWGAVRD